MKMRFIYFVFSILLSSCSWIYYVPNKQNVTLFKEKNEIAGNVAISTGSESTGFEIQGAYSLTNHLAIQGNYQSWASVDNSLGYLAEIAPGYFFPVGNDFVFETYVGLGKGQSFYPLNALFPQLNDVIEVQFDRYFLQPAIGYTSKNIDFAFSTRVCMVDYYGNKPYAWGTNENLNDINYARINQFFTMDPALTFRFGFRNVKIQFQSLYIFPLEKKYQDGIFYDRWNINLGIQLNFGGHFNPGWSEKKKPSESSDNR